VIRSQGAPTRGLLAFVSFRSQLIFKIVPFKAIPARDNNRIITLSATTGVVIVKVVYHISNDVGRVRGSSVGLVPVNPLLIIAWFTPEVRLTRQLCDCWRKHSRFHQSNLVQKPVSLLPHGKSLCRRGQDEDGRVVSGESRGSGGRSRVRFPGRAIRPPTEVLLK
jgi:hypothetical protein